jgi:hypothetical protein
MTMRLLTLLNKIGSGSSALRSFAIIGALAVTLGACGTNPKGSVLGGDCKAFEPPTYVVKGKAQYDQDWIDGNIEAGVGACNWPRPGARPPDLDAPVVGHRAPVIVAPPKKKTLRERLHFPKRKPGVVTSQLPRGRPFDLGDAPPVETFETVKPTTVTLPEPTVAPRDPPPREEEVLDDAAAADEILGKRAPPKAPCAWWQRSC